MKPWEEPQRRDPSPRIDRDAINVMCTEQKNKIKEYTDYNDNIYVSRS